MEILQIAKGRLKISLSKEELTEYGTNLECLEAGNASAKQTLEVIFALVEAKTGLQLTGAQTLIRLFPSKDGGCEIFVLNRERNPSESIPKHSSTCEEHSLLPGDSSRAGFYLRGNCFFLRKACIPWAWYRRSSVMLRNPLFKIPIPRSPLLPSFM